MENKNSKQLEQNLYEYRENIENILGAEQTSQLCKLIITHEFGKKLLNQSKINLQDVNNRIEIAAAKQLPKDTEYDVIGVVNQYVKTLRALTNSKTEKEQEGLKGKLNVCEASLLENYDKTQTQTMIRHAIEKSIILPEYESLKKSNDAEKVLIKKYTDKHPGLNTVITLYSKTYNELETLRKKELNCKCIEK